LLGQLTGIVIAILIFLAACKVGLDVFKGADIQPTHFGVAIAGTLACIAVLHLLAQYKIRVGKEENFRLLIDDGHHSRADVLFSVVVLVGILG
jgi:divalent metal cation (Fe/Co/Zn/Cd) transporter